MDLKALGRTAHARLDPVRALLNLVEGDVSLTTGLEACELRSVSSAIDGLGVAVRLTNPSRAAVQYEILGMGTTLDAHRGRASDQQAGLIGVLDAHQSVKLPSNFVAVQKLQHGEIVTGAFYMRLRFGRTGRMRQAVSFQYAVSFKAASEARIAAFRWTPV